MSNLNNLENQLEIFEQALDKSDEILGQFSLENNRVDLSAKSKELRNDLEDQLKRIRKKDFEIAAVGKEKSGKSSLLNAWIGFDLLPTDSKRCTYTTTEIRSCSDLSGQKYSIEYFTKEEFSKLTSKNLDSLASRGYNSILAKERDEIESLKDQISKYLGKPKVEKKFNSFEEVDDELKSAISEPGHARAVKRIQIWTPKLSEMENVVLHDVPGYDSPLTLHKEQTNAKVAEVDAILFATPFRTPSLNDAEIEILEIGDKTDEFVDIKEKIVVALTFCDDAGSKNEFNKFLRENKQAWSLKNVSESRLIPVCSVVEGDINSEEQMTAMNNLRQLNGGDSGLKSLKEAVNDCIDNLKYKIAIQRYNDIKNKLNDYFSSIKETVKERYKVDEKSEMKESIDDEEMKKIYNEWWAQKWKSVHKKFQSYFYTKIKPNLSPDDPSYLNEDDIQFKNIYIKTIEEAFKNIPIRDRESQALIYNSVVHSNIVAPKYGNIEIRIELASQAMNCIDKLTESLNKFLWSTIDKMIGWMRDELWNIPEIRKEVIGEDEKLASSLIQCSFDALVKRLARPATDIFLRFPRARVERLKVLKEFQMELLVLDKFIINGRLIDRGLYQYLANGKHGKFSYEIHHDEVFYKPKELTDLKSEDVKKKEQDNVKDKDKDNNKEKDKDKDENKESKDKDNKDQEAVTPKKKQNLFERLKNKKDLNGDNDLDTISVSSDFDSKDDKFKETKKINYTNTSSNSNPFEKLTFSTDAENFEQVHQEITQDTAEFIECIKNSVFYGSGIQRYYNQELENIRRKFIDLENGSRRWWFYVDKYINDKDSRVKIPAPNKANEIKNRVFMIKNLQEITKAIEESDI